MKVAIIGASGAVGREMVRDLSDSKLEIGTLGLFASPRSAGQTINFRDKSFIVQAFSLESLKGFDVALMSAGGTFSREWSPKLVELGLIVIDNSSAWRMDEGVPLVVPEVNSHLIKNIRSGIVANPNCSTIQMVVPLKVLHDEFGLRSVEVSTYQSVSGTGQKGISELSSQMDGHFRLNEPAPQVYAHPIAFNLIPAIDKIDPESGHAFEEVKMIQETRKILGLADLSVTATTVRVPVYSCHSESVSVTLGRKVTRSEVFEVLKAAKSMTVTLGSTYEELMTPRAFAGQRGVSVSRIRLPFGESSSAKVQFWVVADNLKKGAATNAVQILERIKK